MTQSLKRAHTGESDIENVKKLKMTRPSIKDMTDKEVAELAISLIDNTSLDLDKETEQSIIGLCQRSVEAYPPTAAVCVYPKWISLCKRELEKTGVSIATVVNFPCGSKSAEEVVQETERSVQEGADEVDLVINYKSFLEDAKKGHEDAVALVKAVKEACGDAVLKVIIEAGELESEELIKDACVAAIQGGTNFVKTSTGKVEVNATETNSRFMLEAVQDHDGDVGFKAAGGVKSVEGARTFLTLAEEIMGIDFVCKKTFRFGASSLLPILRAIAESETPEETEEESTSEIIDEESSAEIEDETSDSAGF